jgi:GNAT superfamily N-acetyltransferase
MSLAIRTAAEADIPLLARMNKQLIEDERSHNPMSVDALAERMRGWLRGDWHIDVVMDDGTPVGYAVYRLRPDEYEPARAVVYVRQFFIVPERRGEGLGRRAFALLAAERFPADCTVALDVLTANPRAARFWAACGFTPYCTTMHLNRTAGTP